MKFCKSFNLNYYLEDLVSYNYLMKIGIPSPGLKGGKSSMTFLKDENAFRLVKGWKAFFYFHQEGRVFVRPLAYRRKFWQVNFFFSKEKAEEWVVYFMDFFFRYVEGKGLKVRTFSSSSGWYFLFRELGDLRFPGLYLDYYNWGQMWVLFLQMDSGVEKGKRMYFSSLKIRYRGGKGIKKK